MKYIRTKDKKGKQYIVSDRDYFFQIRDNKVIFVSGYEEELLKQADTIEELCDEFVEVLDLSIDDESFKHYIHNKPISSEKLFTFARLSNNVKLYGAIWTDKGLIYVAKTKGVLPNGEINWELL